MAPHRLLALAPAASPSPCGRFDAFSDNSPGMIRNIELDALLQTLIAAEQGSYFKLNVKAGQSR